MVLYLFPNRDRQEIHPALETNDKRSANSSGRRLTTNGAAVSVVDYKLYKRIFWWPLCYSTNILIFLNATPFKGIRWIQKQTNECADGWRNASRLNIYIFYLSALGKLPELHLLCGALHKRMAIGMTGGSTCNRVREKL